jgi:protein O-mannosyl-transferase
MTESGSSSSVPPCLRGETRASSTWIIIVLILAAYFRIGFSEFTFWDDQVTIHHNGWFNPPTLATLKHYWTTPEMGLYVPVTSSVWAGLAALAYVGLPDDYGIKLNPQVFHFTSILLHVVSSLLVLRILRRLIGAEVPALAGALLFALHPAQVETLGWTSGMKDLLCWCFALAALLLYVRRAQSIAIDGRPAWRGYELPAAFVLTVLAILSKPTAMVLPAAMGVIDVLLVRRPWRRVLMTLVPFFLLTIAGAILARDAQFVSHVKAAAIWQRPFIVGDALAFYVRKLVWPGTLTIDYGRMPTTVMASPLAYVWWLLPTAIGLAALVAARRGNTLPLAALLVAGIGIGPVSGIATFQMQSYSTVTDHYLYFSMLGVAMLLAWALCRWPAQWLRVVAFAVIAALGVRTWFQTAIWHDSYTLFGHASDSNEKSFLAANNMAAVYLAKTPQDLELAELYVDIAYARAPHDFFVMSNYAGIKARTGKKELAYPAWEECLEFIKRAPRQEDFRAAFCSEVALTLLAAGEFDRAERWMNEAIAANPDEPNTANAVSIVRRALAARASTQPTTTPTTKP